LSHAAAAAAGGGGSDDHQLALSLHLELNNGNQVKRVVFVKQF
jgi:hypothetical protein